MAQTNLADLTVRDNEAESQYEIVADGQVAVLTYALQGNRISLVHTGVPKELEGQGIAGRLARYALEDARRRGLRVVVRART